MRKRLGKLAEGDAAKEARSKTCCNLPAGNTAKEQKGRNTGLANRGAKVSFGDTV